MEDIYDIEGMEAIKEEDKEKITILMKNDDSGHLILFKYSENLY